MVLQERSVQEGQSRRVLPKASWVLLHMVELILTQLVTLRVDQTRRHGPKGHPENFCWQAPSPQDKGGKKPQMAAPRGMVEHLSGVLLCRLTLIDLHHLLTWKISEGSLSQWLITTASPRSEVGGGTSVMPGHSVVVVSHAAIVPVLK